MTTDELEAIRARDADYNDIFEQQAHMSLHIAHRLVAWPVADRRALLREVDRLLAELDRVAPMGKCDCCGKPFRMPDLIPEEGDRWECGWCWEKENARERALIEEAGRDHSY